MQTIIVLSLILLACVGCSQPPKMAEEQQPTTIIERIGGTVEPPPTPKFELNQNTPNPFIDSTAISFEIPVPSRVSLAVYNVTGQRLIFLVNDSLEAGSYARTWNASQASPGIYFYKLEAGAFIQTKKMVRVR